METEIKKKSSGGKIAFIIVLVIILAAVVYYSVMSMMGPGKELSRLQMEAGVKTTGKVGINESVFTDSAYLKLLREKAFLQSRAIMAETDSIYLTVNLIDSICNVEINGVIVHTAKVKSYSISNILMKADKYTVLTMLSTPLTIENSVATIMKEPVMTKMAPKDTSEYIPDITPDTSLVEPVNYRLDMTNGTRLYVYQADDGKHVDRMSFLNFDIRDRLNDTWSSIKSVVHLKVPAYHPYIKIRIPRADAKIIYRALPKNGQIAVCL